MSNQFSNHQLTSFNQELELLKLEFHKTGRFDDANTKLDEIVKLLTVKFLDSRNKNSLLSIIKLKQIAQAKFGSATKIASALQVVFQDLSQDKLLINNDGTHVFGADPRLNIHSVDNDFAEKIINVVNKIDLSNSSNFDFLNEAFGHFIRVSFRNHKEDAQYMTPIEVVDVMANIAFADLLEDKEARKRLFSPKDDFYILDPTCGVGTFLTTAYRKVLQAVEDSDIKNKRKVLENRKLNSFLGQDKVDRMVRMSKINTLFSGLNPLLINQGNSIVGDSFIDRFKGKIDLILTNPPFGASFPVDELVSQEGKYPLLKDICKSAHVKSLDSELILFERCLELLKPGGRLLIVVPDSVVSSQGIYETYRNKISKNYLLKAVIDLPAVTFAQAGTRTKCSVLYLQKPKTNFHQSRVFMAIADDVGYEVKERMGSPVKVAKQENDLKDISLAYEKLKNSKKQILSNKPSAVLFDFNKLINSKWNANFYRSSRISALEKLSRINSKAFQIKSLKDLADFVSKSREKYPVSENTKCISVLHVGTDSMIDFEEVANYRPIGSGVHCKSGEILFSKINPRIPRVAIVPNWNFTLTASSEFEILSLKNKKWIYLLKTMLLTKTVQDQINSLTSGTSSSHNRIKTLELMDLQIPWPIEGSVTEKQLVKFANIIGKSEAEKYSAQEESAKAMKAIESSINL